MRKQVYVTDIGKENVEVNDLFVVTKKGVFSTKNNTRYMSIALKDKTGVIEGKVWNDVDRLNSQFEKNDLVYVQSRSRLYQEKPQLAVTDIRRVEDRIALTDMEAFFPGPQSGMERLREEYFKLVAEIKDPYLCSFFEALHRRKDLLEKFFFFPASVGVHHMYMGGLLEHSLSVARMGKAAAETVGGNMDIVVAGSLLHDIGKVEEITLQGGFRYTDRGRLLGHITLGVMLFDDVVKEAPEFPEETAQILRHIIISHHVVEEWGSPRKPMCVEALTVHYLDNLDAKVMGVREFMKENMEDDKWSQYHRLYESRFYKLSEGNHGD
jgi:3'-5' exoribonuclease